MANSGSISSFSQSLQRFLDRAHRIAGPAALPVTFTAIGGGWLADLAQPVVVPCVTLYLHRVTPSAHARNSRTSRPPGALSVDLHYLLTTWAADAQVEQQLLGWAMEQLHLHAAFDSSVLSSDGGWKADEAVSIFPVDMATDEMARIFETVRRPLRLSWPFVARVVRIETRDTEGEWPRVVALREDFSQFRGREGTNE